MKFDKVVSTLVAVAIAIGSMCVIMVDGSSIRGHGKQKEKRMKQIQNQSPKYRQHEEEFGVAGRTVVEHQYSHRKLEDAKTGMMDSGSDDSASKGMKSRKTSKKSSGKSGKMTKMKNKKKSKSGSSKKSTDKMTKKSSKKSSPKSSPKM